MKVMEDHPITNHASLGITHMKKLTDISEIQYGYAFDSKYFTEDSSYPALVRIRDIKRGYSDTYFSGEYPKEYVLSAGDLLVGMDGEFNIAKWKTDGALLNQRVCKLTAKGDTNEEYLRFAMTKALKEIENRTSFVTVKHLSAKELNKLELDVPSSLNQANIAYTLNKIETIIELRKEELKHLENLIKARFAELFGDCKNQVSLSDLCSIITDGTHQPPKFQETGIPFILVSNLSNNTVTYNTEKYIDEETYNELYKRTPVEIGDLLLSTVGSYGHPAVVTENTRFLFQRHIAYLKPKKEVVNSLYLHSALLTPEGQRQIEEKVKGIAQKTLNLSEIRKIMVPVPEMKEQNEFVEFVERVNKSKLLETRQAGFIAKTGRQINFCR